MDLSNFINPNESVTPTGEIYDQNNKMVGKLAKTGTNQVKRIGIIDTTPVNVQAVAQSLPQSTPAPRPIVLTPNQGLNVESAVTSTSAQTGATDSITITFNTTAAQRRVMVGDGFGLISRDANQTPSAAYEQGFTLSAFSGNFTNTAVIGGVAAGGVISLPQILGITPRIVTGIKVQNLAGNAVLSSITSFRFCRASGLLQNGTNISQIRPFATAQIDKDQYQLGVSDAVGEMVLDPFSAFVIDIAANEGFILTLFLA